jgi:hypothetical protein
MLKLLETDGKNPEFQKIPGQKIDKYLYTVKTNSLFVVSESDIEVTHHT